MIVSYVILHYMAVQDTIECVNSILDNLIPYTKHKVNVIIVDNGSPNCSYGELEKAFDISKNVHLIRSEENLGYAKGNNLGFQYAKYELKSDFIILMNNDTVVRQQNFIEVMVKKYYEKQYHVLGPDIVVADRYHQNPGNKQSWELKELCVFRFKKRIQLLLSYLHMDFLVSKAINNVKEIYRPETLQGDIENTILHGACLIFSPDYVKRFEGLNSETFLYMEEDILKLYADYYGFLMLYSSELQIYHKEDIATNMVHISNEEKKRRKYKLLIQSSKIYSSLKRNMQLKKQIIGGIEKIASNIRREKYSIDLDTPLSYIFLLLYHRVIMLLRGKAKCIGISRAGKVVFCGSNVQLKCKSKIQIGTGVSIQKNVYIDALSKGGVVLGNGCSIGTGTIIRCSGNIKELGVGFRLGDNSSLADNCFVGASGGVFIGNDVIGGQNIRFHSSNHLFDETEILIRKQGIIARGIHIGNNCWIGAGAVFCDGVNIGNGCIIGTNCVVTKSFPDNCILAGVPAKVIRMRNIEKR